MRWSARATYPLMAGQALMGAARNNFPRMGDCTSSITREPGAAMRGPGNLLKGGALFHQNALPGRLVPVGNLIGI
jgi:hypothetical protein